MLSQGRNALTWKGYGTAGFTTNKEGLGTSLQEIVQALNIPTTCCGMTSAAYLLDCVMLKPAVVDAHLQVLVRCC